MRLSFLLIVLTVTLAGSSHASSNLAKVSAIASTQHNQLEHGATRLLRFAETKEEVDDGDLDDDDDDDQGAESEERMVDMKPGVNWVTTNVGNLGSSVKNLIPSSHKLGGAKSSVVSGGDDAAAKVTGNLKTGDDAVMKVATTKKGFFTNDGHLLKSMERKDQLLKELKKAGVSDTDLNKFLTATPDEISKVFKIDELQTKYNELANAKKLLPRKDRNKALSHQVLDSDDALSDAKRKVFLVNEYAKLQKKLV